MALYASIPFMISHNKERTTGRVVTLTERNVISVSIHNFLLNHFFSICEKNLLHLQVCFGSMLPKPGST